MRPKDPLRDPKLYEKVWVVSVLIADSWHEVAWYKTKPAASLFATRLFLEGAFNDVRVDLQWNRKVKYL